MCGQIAGSGDLGVNEYIFHGHNNMSSAAGKSGHVCNEDGHGDQVKMAELVGNYWTRKLWWCHNGRQPLSSVMLTGVPKQWRLTSWQDSVFRGLIILSQLRHNEHESVCSGVDRGKHQSSASLAFVRGIYQSPVNSPHKWPVMREMFPFDDVIIMVSKILLCLPTYIFFFKLADNQINLIKKVSNIFCHRRARWCPSFRC